MSEIEKKYGPPYKKWSEYTREERVGLLKELKNTHRKGVDGSFNDYAAGLLEATPGQIAGEWYRFRKKEEEEKKEQKKKPGAKKVSRPPDLSPSSAPVPLASTTQSSVTAHDLRGPARKAEEPAEPYKPPQKLAASEATQCQYSDCAFEAVPGTRPRRCAMHKNS